jgi:DNA-binding response OmpR family regulator
MSVTSPLSVLLLADDTPSRRVLADALRAQGLYVTDVALPADLPEALGTAERDITLLDTQVTGPGYEAVLAAIGASMPGHPVILVGDAEVSDRVRGLNAGAVDYVATPLSAPELAARIRARIRFERLEHARLRHGALAVDLRDRSVRHHGTALRLSNLELRLLTYFLRNVGVVRTRAEILSAVWAGERSLRSNAVDVYVGYLRRKLQIQGYTLPLTTVRGVGYRLEPVPAAAMPGPAAPSRPAPIPTPDPSAS